MIEALRAGAAFRAYRGNHSQMIAAVVKPLTGRPS